MVRTTPAGRMRMRGRGWTRTRARASRVAAGRRRDPGRLHRRSRLAGGLPLRRAVHRGVTGEELAQRAVDCDAAGAAHGRRRRARVVISLHGDEEALRASSWVPGRGREHLAPDARDPEPADAPRVLVLIGVHRGAAWIRGRRRHRPSSLLCGRASAYQWANSRLSQSFFQRLNFSALGGNRPAKSPTGPHPNAARRTRAPQRRTRPGERRRRI